MIEMDNELKRNRKNLGLIYLIGQSREMDNVAHHPNRLVERAEFVIPVANIKIIKPI